MDVTNLKMSDLVSGWTAFDDAVSQALAKGTGSLELHTVARAAVKDKEIFDNILIGILAAATPKDVWAEAIERAKKGYSTYRSE